MEKTQRIKDFSAVQEYKTNYLTYLKVKSELKRLDSKLDKIEWNVKKHDLCMFKHRPAGSVTGVITLVTPYFLRYHVVDTFGDIIPRCARYCYTPEDIVKVIKDETKTA